MLPEPKVHVVVKFSLPNDIAPLESVIEPFANDKLPVETVGAVTDVVIETALGKPIVKVSVALTTASISFEVPSGGYAYEKQKRKIGDYATAAAAVILSKEGTACKDASIAMTNLSDTPVFCSAASETLVGTAVSAEDIKKAVGEMLEAIDPAEDNRGPVEFKKHEASVVLTRAIERAWQRA